MIETVVILLLSVFFFISGKVRSDIVALCSLVALMVLGILEPAEALSGFSNNVIIMMVGLFVVGGAIFQTGLAKMISSKLMKLAGNSETKLFILVMVVTSLMGAFVSNTGTVAIMIPIVVSMAMSVKMNPSRLLMPLAFASSMSGMMTLIGTPPNLVINEALINNGYEGLGFFTFLPVGLICAFVGTLLLMPLSKRFLSKPGALSGASASSGKSLKTLVKEYGIANNLHRLQVHSRSLLIGKMIGELDVRNNFGINIIEVRHIERTQRNILSKNVVQEAADSDTILRADDMLYVSGTDEKVRFFASRYNLEVLNDVEDENKSGLDFYDIGVAEIVVMSTSSVVNKTIKEVEFRTKYNLSVLGICRNNKYILQGIADEAIHVGDVLPRSLLIGKMIGELDVRNNFGINIIEVRHIERTQRNILSKNVVQEAADSDTILRADDMLYVSGTDEKVRFFASRYNLEVLNDVEDENKSGLDFYDIGVAEIVVMSTSSVVNKTIKEVEFRTKYNLSVLGICRNNKYILQGIADEAIHVGDVLLVQGSWDHIGSLEKDNNEWIVVGRPLEEAAKVTLDYKAPVAAIIMLAMIAVMVFDFIPIAPVTAVMIAGLLMVLTGCFRNVEAAYKTINWESIVLIAAMMPMSVALQKTGVSEWISGSLVSTLGGYSPMLLMAGIYFTTSFMTMFISNTATAVLMAPIAMSAAQQVAVSPVPFLFAVTLGASLCFASPFSTPPNALVMPAGQYKFSDYVKVGLPLQIILGIVMILVLPLLFPF